MRQRIGIIVVILLAVGLLVAINSAAYVSEDERDDSEFYPNRSTYNAKVTGTRALYDLLNESGYKVMRWREAPDRLLGVNGEQVRTFVIVGRPRLPVEEDEAKSILLWVARGGRLIIIDRGPDDNLLPSAGGWKVMTELVDVPFSLNAGQPEQMTEGVKPITPAQPTLLTQKVESVMPSRFVSTIKFFSEKKGAKNANQIGSEGGKTDEANAEDETADDEGFDSEEDEPSPADLANDSTIIKTNSARVSPAPVVHLTTFNGPLLVDYPYGGGRIVLLSDPFIVANGGIALNDNLQLAVNLLATVDGLTAFDEFHQGRGATHNAFVAYFQSTPILAICGQIVLLILLVVWTRGRRFARPLPLARVDRRSSLEFVASMAELQQRARAYDLAIENIYSRTRRVLARYAGVDYNTPRREIATRIAARSTIKAHQLDALMRQAEEAINGGRISERQSVELVKQLREVEGKLGLRMRSRQEKQAAQNI